jgi:hypothetical protein
MSYKNTSYLEELSAACGGMDFGWMGRPTSQHLLGAGRRSIRGLQKHGYVDFRTPEGKDLVRGYDFLITVGNSDANPATILEAMAWGLIPVCTPQSGYEEDDGVVNIPLGDIEKAKRILNHLQEVPAEWLFRRQSENLRRLDAHFNWDRFAGQVVSCIEGEASPPLAKQAFANKALIRANMLLLSEMTCLFRPSVVKNFVFALNKARRSSATTLPLGPRGFRLLYERHVGKATDRGS